ncbi:hypothetical protein VT06_03835 [Arsukibacterium sp. MJ3]|jgi:uncharacterized protein YqcC (DUF446 family)|uniref:YqcC family protein n=1 Tax=Arsukibacterium sp. MJ3 TaxID=1632859 RepID=UPI00062715AD|nr:YqcC family protein [Arsukibacterium sp. MJ3]KKO50121.1 hypothetical protein VT06_03835 [Arsukibacterium sp. MJ3]
MSDAVKYLLIQLETELQQRQLWSSVPASDVAMASEMPFCCDTLRLEQWLQFIFLPKIQALLAAQRPLPTNVSILPMAEEAFKTYGQRMTPLLQIIHRLDQTFSGDV